MKLSKQALKKTFWRSLPLQGAFNYERQQAIGWVYGLVPALKEIYKDDEEGLKEALSRHTSFYNTSPQTTTFIQGVVLALEEEKAHNPEIEGEAIVAVRTALIGPLAAIGDSLFFGTFRTIGLGIGIALALDGNYLGPVLFWLIHNIPHYLLRYYGLKWGYEQGMNMVAGATDMIEEVTWGTKIVGSMVVGTMVASMVKVSTTITLNFANLSYPIQDFFNSLMPALLPLLFTFGCYRLLKKGMSTTKILFGILLLGILLVWLEGLPFFLPVVS